jgi:hypothetical protein
MDETLNDYVKRHEIKLTGNKEIDFNSIMNVLLKDSLNERYGGKRRVIIDSAKLVLPLLRTNKTKNPFNIYKKLSLALEKPTGNCLYVMQVISALIQSQRQAIKKEGIKKVLNHFNSLQGNSKLIISPELIHANPNLLNVISYSFSHTDKELKNRILFVLKEQKTNNEKLNKSIQKFIETNTDEPPRLTEAVRIISKKSEQRKKYYEQHPEKNPKNKRKRKRR